MHAKQFNFIIVLFIALWGFSVSSGFAEEAPSPKAPKAVVPEPNYKFKAVPEGTKVVHDFVIKNEGTDTLIITKVKPG